MAAIGTARSLAATEKRRDRFPPIAGHGLISERQTAALIAKSIGSAATLRFAQRVCIAARPQPQRPLPDPWEEAMSTHAVGMPRPGVSVGSTSEFSLFFRVKPGHEDALREAVGALQRTPGYRPGDYDLPIATIHEARFVLFDDDTRLLFATSFDGPWDAYMVDFASKPMQLFDAIFRHVEGYEGLPDVAALQDFILGAQVTAAAYARNYGGTVKEIRKAERVNNAFQQVLDDPDAAAALQHPALRPLLDEAAD